MGRFLVATLVYGSFALQLLLAARGATCVMPDGGVMDSRTASADMAMAGMDMRTDMPVPSGGSDPAPSDAPNPLPCDQPATPASCHIMAPCATSFIAVLPVVPDAMSRTPSIVIVTPALELASRTFPPELPPPRA